MEARRPIKLLWLENHAAFARLAARQFLASHYVTVVPSLAEARAAVLGESFDVVIVDYDLDDGKGDELVRDIRGGALRPSIVAASSHEAGNDALVAAGADAVCGKLRFARIGELLERLSRREAPDV